jgi:RHS repeat-associated protein
MRPARPRGLAALRTLFSGWLRRATLALTLIPLAAGAVIYTSDADLAAKLQAFITRVIIEPVRICCNAEIGGRVVWVIDLDGPGNVDPCAKPRDEMTAAASSTGKSSIDVQMMNYRHWAFEWKAPGDSAGAGCVSCGGAGGGAGDGTRLWWGRVHRFREATQRSSFGPCVFSPLDFSLSLWTQTDGTPRAQLFHPSWQTEVYFTPDGEVLRDTALGVGRHLRLLDAAGVPTMVPANAVSAEFEGLDGRVWTFGLIPDSSGGLLGRLTGWRDVSGRGASVSYDDAGALGPDDRFRVSSATDSWGNALSFSWTRLPSGRWAVSAVSLPGGRSLSYAYDQGGFLISSTQPDGAVASFSRTVSGSNVSVVLADAAADAGKARRTVALTTNIGSLSSTTSALGITYYPQASALVRTVRNGAGQVAFAVANGGNSGSSSAAWRLVHEGGSSLRFVDGTSESTSYRSWSFDTSAASAFAAVSGVKEAQGTFTPYSNYLAVARGTPPWLTTPQSVTTDYTWDTQGNLAKEAPRGASAARSWSRDASARPLVATGLDGLSERWSYDATGQPLSHEVGLRRVAAPAASLRAPGLRKELFTTTSATTLATVAAVPGEDVSAPAKLGVVGGQRLTGWLRVPVAGSHRIVLNADDEAVLYLDGVKVLRSTWQGGVATVTLNLSAGDHAFRLLHTQAGGPERLDLSWSGPSTAGVARAFDAGLFSHDTAAGELVASPTSAYAKETWERVASGPLKGLATAHVSFAGLRTEFTYDAYARLASVRVRDGSGWATSTIARDAQGRVAATTDPAGRTATYAYDARDRVVSVSYLDGTADTFAYGSGAAANLVVSSVDRVGRSTETAYDADGRVASVTQGRLLAGAVQANPSVTTYAYVTGRTEPLSVSTDGDAVAYAYDYRFRQVSSTRSPWAGASVARTSAYVGNRLFRVVDDYGRATFYAVRTWDGAALREVRELVAGAAGNPTDGAAVLALSRSADLAITDHEPDQEGRDLAVTDPRGARTAFVRDDRGRLVGSVDALGAASSLTLDADGRVTADLPPAVAGEPAAARSVSYDARGLVAAATDRRGNASSFAYTVDGRQASVTDPLGNVASTVWHLCCARPLLKLDADGDGVVAHYLPTGEPVLQAAVRSASGLFASSRGTASSVTASISLPSDRTLSATTTSYDSRGRPVRSTRWLVAPPAVSPTSVPHAASPAQGLVTVTDYVDAPATDARLAALISAASAKGAVLQQGMGSAVLVTRPDGVREAALADGLGRPLASALLAQDGSVSALRVTLVDADQGLVRTRVSDALGTASAWADANGSVRRSADALGNASTAAYDAAGSLLSSLDAEGRASTRTLDVLGRVLSSSDALGNTASSVYDARGRVVSSTGPAGDVTAFAYDADGRTLASSVTRSADARVRTERTAYDARGLAIATTDGEGRATTYGYDAAGRPVLRTRPDGASASSTVDLLDRVTAVVHEDGTTSAYAYDMLSRVVSRSGVGLAESWSYDASGRPSAAARGGVALAWSYDPFGRVAAESRDGRTVAASRDADGRLASFSAPGIAQTFAYDAAGRLTTVAVPGQADAYVSYDRSGLEAWRLARAGGSDVLRTDLHRDAAGRPLEVAATSSSGAQAGLLRTLDPEGAPLTQVDQSGKGWSFSRDLGTRELLGAQELGGGSASVATGYDLSGLRATHSDLLSSGAWSSNAAGETSQARGRPVVNDLLGRVTSLDGWNHTYSCDGLLLSSEPSAPAEGSRRSTHAYDALGRRVRTVVQAYVGGQWTAFSTTERDFIGRLPLGIETSFTDGSSKSWRFLRGPDASGTLEGAGGARGVLAVLKDASSWKAVAADTLGNVLALAGTNGDFTRRTFDPWGNPLVRDASGSLRASTLSERRADYDALPLAWASQEVDPDTGLTHYHFREYSPSLGGWLTRDPIGLAGGYLNLRSYLGNRPADELDVWGEIPALLVPVVGAAVGGVAGGLVSGGLEFLQTGDWDKTLEATKTGAIAGSAAGFTMTGGALIIGPAAAATTAGVVTLGVAGGASAQVAVNIATDRPMSEDILPAMAVGGLAGPVGRAVHKQLAPPTNRLWREMIKRPTARQAAESSAAKQSVAAAEGTQAHALERKAIEEAKKSPCAEAAEKAAFKGVSSYELSKLTSKAAKDWVKGASDVVPAREELLRLQEIARRAVEAGKQSATNPVQSQRLRKIEEALKKLGGGE